LTEEVVDQVGTGFQSIAFEQDTVVEQEEVHPSSTPRAFLLPAWGRNGRRGSVLPALDPQLFLFCLEDSKVCQAQQLALYSHGLEESIQGGIQVNRTGSLPLRYGGNFQLLAQADHIPLHQVQPLCQLSQRRVRHGYPTPDSGPGEPWHRIAILLLQASPELKC